MNNQLDRKQKLPSTRKDGNWNSAMICSSEGRQFRKSPLEGMILFNGTNTKKYEK